MLAQVKREQLTREGGDWSDSEEAAFKKPILDTYEQESSPYFATARLWDDGIIDPPQTRNVLSLALSATYNAPMREPRMGVFRM